jgi:hypothetical protein
MAETENIAQLAEIVSRDLFSQFFWGIAGSWNQNWPCENKLHAPRKTHPSDVVFYYDEPYTVRRTYVNCDLKSYATGTITTGAILSAAENLAASLSCMEISETWNRKYTHEGCSAFLCGMLFIYNHDGEYDKDFDRILRNLNTDNLTIPKGSHIVILGPQQIRWLDNVRYEMVYMRGTKELPDSSHCRFEYPHPIRKKKVQVELAKAATLEMLTGPWIAVAYDAVDGRPPGYLVFYKGAGASSHEFLYLIDYLMHYQMVRPGTDIKIRTLEPDKDSAAFFNRAIQEYIENSDGGTEYAALLSRISYRQLNQIHRSFSSIEVGMRHA